MEFNCKDEALENQMMSFWKEQTKLLLVFNNY